MENICTNPERTIIVILLYQAVFPSYTSINHQVVRHILVMEIQLYISQRNRLDYKLFFFFLYNICDNSVVAKKFRKS